jgi:hypothetical protein
VASGQGLISFPVQAIQQAQGKLSKGVRGWLAVWCVGAIVFHLFTLLSVFGSKTVSVSSEAVNLVLAGLATYGILTAISVLLVKPYALQLVFLNFLQWAVVLVLVFPVLFLTISPGATPNWQPVAEFVAALGIPWIIWFRYFKISKRVLATFGRNM